MTRLPSPVSTAPSPALSPALATAGRPRLGALRPLSAALWLAGAASLGACGGKLPDDSDDSGDTGAAGGDGGDASLAWEDVRLESASSFTGAFASGAGLYATAEDGKVYLRSQGTWQGFELDTRDPLNGVWGRVDGATVQVVGVGDGGAIATFDGASWSAANALGNANMESIAGVDEQNLIAVGWAGIFELVEGEWVFQAVPENPQFNHVWYDGTVAVAVGEEGAISMRRAGTWTTTFHSSRKKLYGVSGASATELWAVGEGGLLLRYDGSQWTEIPTNTTSSLWAVLARGPNDAVVVGSNGVAFQTDGAEITDLPTGVDNNLYALAVSSTNTVWAVGNRGMTLRLR